MKANALSVRREKCLKITVIELYLPHANNESDVREFLKQNPDKVGLGLKFVADEFPLYGGIIDMVFMDSENTLRFVELKFSKYHSNKIAIKAEAQLLRYYRGIISFMKLLNFDINKIYLYLVIGFSESIEDTRYFIEMKDGKLFYDLDKHLNKVREEESLYEKYSSLKSDLRQEIINLEKNRDELIKNNEELSKLKLNFEFEVNNLIKIREAQLKHYGDKLLYILPDFWSQGIESRTCFICGVKSDIAIQTKQGLYGLCNEHFRMINKYTPYLKPIA